MPETLTRKQRRKIENLTLFNSDYTAGRVVINLEKCSGCRMCVEICPGNALMINADSKPELKSGVEGMCMACGDCTAICPSEAICIDTFLQFNYFFHYLDRGNPEPPRRF